MRAPSSGYVAIAALVCVAALPSARASAAAPAGIDDAKEARRLFQRAELSFNLGKFEDALADYQSAYQAKPLTGFLFNIAQCYRNLGNWERARFFYRRYLTLAPRSPNRHQVEDLVAEMTGRLEKQQATLPLGTSGVAAAPSEPAIVTAPPVTPPAAVVPALPQPSVAPAPSSALVVSRPPAPERKPVYKRWWFWTGVGALVVGGVVSAVVLSRPTTRTPGTLDPIDAR
ncbi:MAG: Tetratricopeptide repeat domain protein [Myxococcales bacterium]|nr:Tetratricopeptide repeat domain protein [Myxococcales bacterium]